MATVLFPPVLVQSHATVNTSGMTLSGGNGTGGSGNFGGAILAENNSSLTLDRMIISSNFSESSGTTTVNYATADGTAIAGQDYTAVGGTLTFAPGETSKFISIPIINDTIYEGGVSETFSLSLSNPTGADTQLLFPNSTTIPIFDNEQFPRISGQNATVNKGPNVNTSIANVTVRLNNSSVQPVSVNYATANGTAIAGADYQATSGTLTFAPNESVKTILVTIYGDSNFEPTETFTVNLTNPVNGTVSIPQATVTIVNYAALSQRPNFDFTGDGKADSTVFRPSDTNWYIRRSSDGGYTTQQFGAKGNAPAGADYDGDGKSDIAIWRASSSEWWIRKAQTPVLSRFSSVTARINPFKEIILEMARRTQQFGDHRRASGLF